MFCSLRVQNKLCYRRAWGFWSKWRQWFPHLDRLSRWLSGFKWAYRIGWSACPRGKLFYCRRYSERESSEKGFAWTQTLFRKTVWLHWEVVCLSHRTLVFFSTYYQLFTIFDNCLSSFMKGEGSFYLCSMNLGDNNLKYWLSFESFLFFLLSFRIQLSILYFIT